MTKEDIMINKVNEYSIDFFVSPPSTCANKLFILDAKEIVSFYRDINEINTLHLLKIVWK